MSGAGDDLFVGRIAESRRLRSVLDAGLAGPMTTVVVAGEAGVGKTSLVSRVVAELESADAPQPGLAPVRLSATCLPLSAFAIPLLALRDALHGAPRGWPEPPELLERDRAVATAPVEVAGWLEQVCALRPVIISIDDLQWADRSSLEVLLYLIAGRRHRRLTVVLTVRSTELGPGHLVHPWLADARRIPGVEGVDLGPLSRSESAAQVTGLIGAPPHDSLLNEVFERTQGNAYLNRLLVTGLAASTRQLPATLPSDLRGALMAGWHRLDPDARHLTAVVAVGGWRFTGAELGVLVGRHVPDLAVQPALRAAVAGHVLELDADGTYWFGHPLQAEVLRDRLSPDEQGSWHEIFAEHLRARTGADAPGTATLIRIADHDAAAGRGEQAAVSARRAGAAAERSGAYPDAIRLLRRAVELADGSDAASGTARPERLEELRHVRQLAARVGDVVAERMVVDELMRALDPTGGVPADLIARLELAELVVRRIHLRQMLAEDFAPAPEAERAVQLAAAAPGAWQYAYALAEQARVSIWTSDARAAETAELALVIARRTGHAQAISYALTATAMAAVETDVRVTDPHASGVRLTADVLARVREAQVWALRADDGWAYAHAVQWEANATETWISADHARLIRRARLDLVRRRGAATYIAVLAAVEAGCALAVGDWSTCAELLRELLGTGLVPWADVGARLAATRLATQQGRVDEAAAHLERAREIAAGLPAIPAQEFVPVQVELLLATGRCDEAARTALDALTDTVGSTMCEWLVPLAAQALADRLVRAAEAGVVDPAAEQSLHQLEQEHPHAVVEGDPSPIVADSFLSPYYREQLAAFAAWYRAECGRARSRVAAGEEWSAVAERLTGASLPWEAAYAWFRAAESSLRGPHVDRHAGARALREADARGRQLGATPLLDRVRRLARTTRIALSTPAERDQPAITGLTRRENEILAHVVAGRTYREIAESLMLSEKTVSSHISNMLRKTGATNRVDLARRVTGAQPG